MSNRRYKINRRKFIGSTIGASSLMALSPTNLLHAGSGPWSVRPSSNVDRVSFVVWAYGKIYTQIAEQFEADWGVPVEANISPNRQHETKLTTMYGAGDIIDVAMTKSQFFASHIAQGLVEPIDNLPGAKDYINNLTNSSRALLQSDGKTWGLPYFSAIWGWNYNEIMMDKAGLSPFTSLEELVEQSVKVKRDGLAKYPLIWVANATNFQGTWFSLVWNNGGVVFDKHGDHHLGPGSVARETLRWWGDGFTKWNIADPVSMKNSTGKTSKAFGAGTNLYFGGGGHYSLNQVNNRDYPISGHMRLHNWPNPNRILGNEGLYYLSSANRDIEWAWKMLQYLGGRTKDGEYTQAIKLATTTMLGSGYTSVNNSPTVRKTWSKWADVELLLKMWDKATYVGEVAPVFKEPWYAVWNKQMVIEAHKCANGQITADQACDNMIASIDKAKRSVSE